MLTWYASHPTSILDLQSAIQTEKIQQIFPVDFTICWWIYQWERLDPIVLGVVVLGGRIWRDIAEVIIYKNYCIPGVIMGFN